MSNLICTQKQKKTTKSCDLKTLIQSAKDTEQKNRLILQKQR